MKNKKLLGWAVVVAALVLTGAGIYVFYPKAKSVLKPTPMPVESTPTLENGRQCYTYSHAATTAEPYDVTEFVDITAKEGAVAGTKTGTQKGPDMTNGYSGTLTGSVSGDTLTVVFSYTIEGSKNKEQELYRIRQDKIGIEKLRYPLIEKNSMLVPDTSQEFKTMLYARVECTGSR